MTNTRFLAPDAAPGTVIIEVPFQKNWALWATFDSSWSGTVIELYKVMSDGQAYSEGTVALPASSGVVASRANDARVAASIRAVLRTSVAATSDATFQLETAQ